jgi:hypothetical protein
MRMAAAPANTRPDHRRVRLADTSTSAGAHVARPEGDRRTIIMRLLRLNDITALDTRWLPIGPRQVVEVVEVRITGAKPYDDNIVDVAVAADGRQFIRPIEEDDGSDTRWYEDTDESPRGQRPWVQARHLPDGRYGSPSGALRTRDQIIADFG